MISAQEALHRLREGNRRFVTDSLQHCREPSTHARRDALIEGQAPFAALLGCADSRVPAEIIFDQGLGDLFDIRVAGNIAASSQIGSLEYAVEYLGTRLVVVLGHSNCGAVAATIEDVQHRMERLSPHMRTIVDHISPTVAAIQAAEPWLDGKTMLAKAVRMNIRAAVNHLVEGSTILVERVRDGDVLIVGAEYSIETGEVEFFDA